MTDESDKSGVKWGELVPQPHGGALRRGSLPGNTPGTGRPRNELRDMLRNFAWEKWPDMLARWGDLTDDQQMRALDTALKYGLGTQTEAVTPEDLKDAAKRIVQEIVTILLDEEHWPREKVQGVIARITRAADGEKT